jgi:hypothetical protein
MPIFNGTPIHMFFRLENQMKKKKKKKKKKKSQDKERQVHIRTL